MLLSWVSDYPSLGLEDYRIKDSELSASSVSPGCLASYSRANFSSAAACASWCPLSTDDSHWLQVDMEDLHHVTAVANQKSLSGHVTLFNISHSLNAKNWTTLNEVLANVI